MSLMACADIAVRGLAEYVAQYFFVRKKKISFDSPKNASVCASVMVTDSSQYDTLPHTSGICGGGGEERSRTQRQASI